MDNDSNQKAGKFIEGFFKAFIVYWIIGVLGGLVFTGTMIYILWHFISKAW